MEILLSEQQIQQKVSELATAISQIYGQRTVHVVGLLDNAFIFTADLVRRLTCPVMCSLVRVEMRDVVENGYDRRLIAHTPILEVKGQDVLVVNCVLHTGVTQEHLIQQFLAKGAASVRSAVLINKCDERRVPLQPDFAGFEVQARFLVGYGMGEGDLYRNLPYIGKMAAGPAREPQAVPAAQ